jgi:hypothetical protein
VCCFSAAKRGLDVTGDRDSLILADAARRPRGADGQRRVVPLHLSPVLTEVPGPTRNPLRLFVRLLLVVTVILAWPKGKCRAHRGRWGP